VSTDLGGSSNYSHEMDKSARRQTLVCLAVKTVVEEVSLPMAYRQGLVGSKCMVNSVHWEFHSLHEREAGLRFLHLTDVQSCEAIRLVDHLGKRVSSLMGDILSSET